MRDIIKLSTWAKIEKSWWWVIASIKRQPKNLRAHWRPLCTSQIIDTNYETANLRDVVKNNCTHQNAPEQSSLLKLLQDFEELFDRTLGDWDCELVSLQLQEGAQPYDGQPFPIPKQHLDVTKKQIQRICNLGVLQWQADSEWAPSTFMIPKKDNTMRVVSDFREINKRIVRKPFSIPKSAQFYKN